MSNYYYVVGADGVVYFVRTLPEARDLDRELRESEDDNQ